MTTPTLEKQARCQAALKSKTVWNEFAALKDHPGKWWLRSADQSITPMLNITTAEGREAILELLAADSGLLFYQDDQGWHIENDTLTVSRLKSPAEAITAAWYVFVNRWMKEQGDA